MKRLLRQDIFERDNHQCVYCGNKERLEIGHFIAKFNGGHNCEDNLQVECRKCNHNNGHKNREKGAIKGCSGCNKFTIKPSKNKIEGHRFECYNCNKYRIEEISLTMIIEKKDKHFDDCYTEFANRGKIAEF